MRIAFLVLLLLNLALLAWTQFAADDRTSEGPGPAARQIDPQKLPIVEAAATNSPGAGRQAAAGDGSTAAAVESACIEWGGFATAEAPRARAALDGLSLGARLAERRSGETAGWWVFIPSQGNRPAAQKKAAELKALGIEDYFIIEDDTVNRFALSLGIFSTDEGARARLDALRDRGVRTAQLSARDTPVQKVWIQVRAPSPAELAGLRNIAVSVSGTELRPCPAPGA